MSNTYICKCGKVLETKKGHLRNDQCSEEWKITYRCGFCGEDCLEFIVDPHYQLPKADLLLGKVICKECKDRAYHYLLKEL